jgi:16S rRNA (cytosine967-C5)-methyltransferase
LKDVFRRNKKFGSRDRKWIRELCYARFRSGTLLNHLSDEDALLWSLYLASDEPSTVLSNILVTGGPEFAALDSTLSLLEKLKLAGVEKVESAAEKIFPFLGHVSDSLESVSFALAMLRQPDVWIRVRTGEMETVTKLLDDQGILYRRHSAVPLALALPSGISLDGKGILESGLAEVQDLSSQRTIEFMPAVPGQRWLDACAASGGKSLLLMDRVSGIDLTVSDNRVSVLKNLDERFKRNGISKFSSVLRDWSQPALAVVNEVEAYDGIIADVPCSGSGTWARTPEQQRYFTAEKITEYSSLQFAIVSNLIPALKSGGSLVYITCSVFREENEMQLNRFAEKLPVKVIRQEYLSGIDQQADTMFAALLQKL